MQKLPPPNKIMKLLRKDIISRFSEPITAQAQKTFKHNIVSKSLLFSLPTVVPTAWSFCSFCLFFVSPVTSEQEVCSKTYLSYSIYWYDAIVLSNDFDLLIVQSQNKILTKLQINSGQLNPIGDVANSKRCWSSRKCNCACELPAEVQLRLRVTRRSWQKLFAGKNFVKILVTAQTQLRSFSEQQRAFGNSNICNWTIFLPKEW